MLQKQAGPKVISSRTSNLTESASQQASARLTATDLDRNGGDINLATLRHRKKEADKVIEILKVRINYLKSKEVQASKKEESFKRRSLEIEKVKRQSLQLKERQSQLKRRYQSQVQRKQEANQEMRASMDYNKTVISAIYNAKKEREVQKIKSAQKKIEETNRSYVDNLNQEQLDRVRRRKEDRITYSEKMEMYMINRMAEMKGIKERKLDLQLKLRGRNQARIQQLRSKETGLKEQVEFSEKFRFRCEEDYFGSRQQYRQFYLSRLENKRRSVSQSQTYNDDSDSNIFVS